MIPRSREEAAGDGPEGPALDDFLGSLGHDLRSPLGVLEEAVRSLSNDLAPHLTDEHRLLVTLAKRSLLRLRRTADTVSLVGALGAGPLEPTRGPNDLVEIARGTVQAAIALAARREVKLSVEPLASRVVVAVDPALMSRALSEVVLNAIRHAWRQVSVRVGIEADQVPGEVRVVVEDDGQGVAEARRPTLFERFAPSSARSGLGVGLSIARDILASHGGHIALEASTLIGRPGTVGARFILSLPSERASAPPHLAARA